MKIKVGVIFGGETVEHEVSIITAVQAMEYMDLEKYEVIPIYISKDRIWYTGEMLKDMSVYRDFDNLKRYAKRVVLLKKDGRFCLQQTHGLFKSVVTDLDIAFPIVHGKGVEDGSLAGYLEMVGIPYVGPGILGASIGQDKVALKQILQANHLPVIDYTWFYDYEYVKNTDEILKKIDKLGYPVIVKPACLGSSIGITVAKTKKEIDTSIREALQYERKIIVEKVVPNLLEVDCAVLGNYEYQETSLVGEMITDNDFLTFDDKYLSSSKGKMSSSKGKMTNGKLSTTGFEIPASIDQALADKIYQTSIKAFRALNLTGVTRFDFLIDQKKKQIYINEPNTIPGCLSFFFFTPKGKEYTKLLDELINYAIRDYKAKDKKVTSFESNVLSTFQGGKGMKTKTGNIISK